MHGNLLPVCSLLYPGLVISLLTNLGLYLSDPLDSLRKSVFADALSWSEEEGTSRFVGGNGNRLVSLLFSLAACLANTLTFHSGGHGRTGRIRCLISP